MRRNYSEHMPAFNNELLDVMADSIAVERSHADMIDDANITADIKSNLMRSQYNNGLSTDVDTFNNKVTLSGTVDSENAREMAGRLAMNTLTVVSVDNRLEVCASKSMLEHDAAAAAIIKTRDIADSWISTKVRSTFLSSTNITGYDIVVQTLDGVVTLSGKVESDIERAFAVELAQHIRGVKSVNASPLTLA